NHGPYDKELLRGRDGSSGESANLLTGRSVVRTRPLPLDFPCLGLGNRAVSQSSCFSRVAWQLGTRRVLQLNDLLFIYFAHCNPPIVELTFSLLTYIYTYNIPFSCSTLSVPYCHATRRLHEGWDTVRLPKPRQGKSRGRGPVRTTDLPVINSTRDITKLSERSFVTPFRCIAAMPPGGCTRAELLPGCPSLEGSGEMLRMEREFTERKFRSSNPTSASRLLPYRLGQPDSIPALVQPSGGMAVRHRKGATAGRANAVNTTEDWTFVIKLLYLESKPIAVSIFQRNQQRLPWDLPQRRPWKKLSITLDQSQLTRVRAGTLSTFSCSTLSPPNCHATRRRHEGWDTARLSKPRQGKSRVEVGFESQTFRSVNSRSNHSVHLAPSTMYQLGLAPILRNQGIVPVGLA
ncbi:hypothetical protein T265_15432, partial [Opisthorchis viverrini]